MLPAVMRWNKPANAERQQLVAAAMGHPGEDAGELLDRFIASLDMPRSLGDSFVHLSKIHKLAEVNHDLAELDGSKIHHCFFEGQLARLMHPLAHDFSC